MRSLTPKFLLLLVCCILCTSHCLLWNGAAAAVLPSDTSALLAIKAALNSPSSLSSWESSSEGEDPCGGQWRGVINCTKDKDSKKMRITSLILSGMGLEGQLPTIIGSLDALTYLDLMQNPGLTGSIPEEIGQLTNLQVLNLANCGLSGFIPSGLRNMLRLRVLSLHDNKLSGNINLWLASLVSLRVLDLSNNRLTGNVPVSPGIDSLKLLEHIQLSGNQLTNLPRQLSLLTNLKTLLLDHNSIPKGPNFLPRLPDSLQVLRLDENAIGGSVPPSFSNLTNLVTLSLSRCSITGTFPDLSGMAKLQRIDVSYSDMTDMFPIFPEVDGSFPIRSINLAGTDIIGPLPSQINLLDNLVSINVDNTPLTGSIPSFNGSIQSGSLAFASLVNTQLSQPLSPSLASLAAMGGLRLSGDSFCLGSSSYSLAAACQQASNVSLEFPSWNAEPICPDLPCSTATSASPIGLILRGQCLCRRPVVVTLRLLAPPSFFWDVRRAVQFASAVESQLGLLQHQVALTAVESNNLQQQHVRLLIFPPDTATASSPWTVQDAMRLVSLFSSHEFEPGEDFGPYNVVEFSIPPEDAIAGPPPPLLAPTTESKSSTPWGLIFGLVVCSLIFVSCSVCFVLLVRKEVWQDDGTKRSAAGKGGMMRGAEEDDAWDSRLNLTEEGRGNGEVEAAQLSAGGGDEAGLKVHGLRYFSQKDMEKATANFLKRVDETNYGEVYLGDLPNWHRVIIKRSSMSGRREPIRIRFLMADLKVLAKLNHKNLLQLQGFGKEKSTLFLVYESFHGAASLFSHLHGLRKMDGQLGGWIRRMHVLLGAARGLNFLHCGGQVPVIHSDLKPENILLDEDGEVKLSDFGISGLATETAVNKERGTIYVKGSKGYICPEYEVTGQLTSKCDVYSFGVIMIEMLTGWSGHVRDNFTTHIRDRATEALKESGNDPKILLDASVRDSLPPAAASKFVQLALRCTARSGHERPTMGEVVTELVILKNILEKSQQDSAQQREGRWHENSNGGFAIDGVARLNAGTDAWDEEDRERETAPQRPLFRAAV